MKKVKILLAVLLAAVMVIALVACNNTCKDGEHVWGTPKVNTAATCTTKGSQTKKCTVCGKEVTEDIPALDHDYSGQPYVSVGEEGHHQECSRCHNSYKETLPHNLTYKPIAGQQKHTVSCSNCNYTATADCTLDKGGVCTLCHANYGGGGGGGDKVTVKVHFHLPSTWTVAQLKVFEFDKSGGKLFGEFPGTGKPTAEDGENEGWYVISFELVQSQITSGDAAVIFTDKQTADGTGNQTGDVVITAAEIWIPGLGGTTKAFTTKEEALAEEKSIDTSAWFLSGDHNSWATSTSDKNYIFSEENNYTLTLTFAANKAFKVKQNDGTWDTSYGYSALNNVTSDVFTTGDLKSLFKSGGEDGSNIVVGYACKLEITFDATAHKINVKILEATGFDPSKVPTPTGTIYLFMYQVKNDQHWTDDTGKALTFDEATGTYKLTGMKMYVGDKWKIKKKGIDWDVWSVKAGSTISVSYADSITKKPTDDLFGGGDNFEVNYDCTFDLELTPGTTTGSVKITVTEITVPDDVVTYTYRFHVFAPANIGSGLQFHVWGAISPTGWNTGKTTAEEGHPGWYVYTYTSKVPASGNLSIIIHKGDTKYAIFNDGSGTGPAVALKEDMYFVYNIKTVYTSYEAAEAVAGFTVTNVTPVQVATVPQISRKDYRLAA